MADNEHDELFDELERRALHSLPEDEDDDSPNLVEALRADEGNGSAAPVVEPAADLTLGGYIELHQRVPAFEGSDGMPYTVDVDVEAGDDADTGFVAFFIFLRWAETGAGIMDHVESSDVARGATEDEARQAAMELSLYEVKAELDAAISRRKADLED
jgi:hypothetical protein